MKENLKQDYLWAALFIMAAVFFMSFLCSADYWQKDESSIRSVFPLLPLLIHRCIHVRLDLGLSQGTVVDTDVVKLAQVGLAECAVDSQPQAVAPRLDAPGLCGRELLDAIQITFDCGAVIREGDVGPGGQGWSHREIRIGHGGESQVKVKLFPAGGELDAVLIIGGSHGARIPRLGKQDTVTAADIGDIGPKLNG